jgi:hypothetical protein
MPTQTGIRVATVVTVYICVSSRSLIYIHTPRLVLVGEKPQVGLWLGMSGLPLRPSARLDEIYHINWTVQVYKF